MTPLRLTKELCKREGLKKQVDIAQMKEIVGHLADIVFQVEQSESDVFSITGLYTLGAKRARAKFKKKAAKK